MTDTVLKHHVDAQLCNSSSSSPSLSGSNSNAAVTEVNVQPNTMFTRSTTNYWALPKLWFGGDVVFSSSFCPWTNTYITWPHACCSALTHSHTHSVFLYLLHRRYPEARGIMFVGWPSIRLPTPIIVVNVMSQKIIPSNLGRNCHLASRMDSLDFGGPRSKVKVTLTSHSSSSCRAFL